jgi:hypothetical protein
MKYLEDILFPFDPTDLCSYFCKNSGSEKEHGELSILLQEFAS